MLDLEKALTSTDLETLNKIIIVAEEKANRMYRYEQTRTCERLCYKKNVFQFNKLKIEKHIKPEYICDYCQRKFHAGDLPAYSVLNNLFVHNVPDEIASLKQYEKMLIQRAKAFQTIVKMGTVINKKLPQRQLNTKRHYGLNVEMLNPPKFPKLILKNCNKLIAKNIPSAGSRTRALRLTNNRECGVLEAADTLLGIPLHGTDRNTIFCPSVIDSHYPNRPEELKIMSLYEFVQWYDVTKIKPSLDKLHFNSGDFDVRDKEREGAPKKFEDAELQALGGNLFPYPIIQDFKDLGDIQEINISKMISKLNADRRRVFDRVTNTITSGKSLLHLYVSGEGSKSFLIKTIKCWLKQNLKKDTAVAVPTGIAHRLLQLPVEHGHTPKYKQLANHVLKVLRADLKDVSLIISDEVSIIYNLIFMYIHLRLSEKEDLLQLPPVHEDPAFIQLTAENIRKYLGSLSAINLWTLLKKKISFKGEFLKLKEILLIAEDTIDCILYMKKKVAKVLANNDDDDTRTAELSKQITIKIGAKVMIRRNINASLGLVNDTIATVYKTDKTTDYIEKIKILLPSGLEYFIERISVKFQVMDKVYVIRLSLSYGISIHKSQGLSLQNAVMDLGNNIFSCDQAYVALFRVTSLDGLHLINFDPSSVFASEKAIIEYNRLKRSHNSESGIITISKQRYRKVKDISWTLSKIITSVQESGQKAPLRSAWIIRGFQNTDKVSCYANAILQCLLNLYIFRKELLNYDNNLNTYKIRQSLGKYFSVAKRDAIEFLTALCTKYNYI
ncbi:PIF1 helicase, partial [Acromyrmex heyeri]